MECPLCQTQHPLLVNGLVLDMQDRKHYHPVEDRGYAFCNCRNIFYTDWSNIDQRVYDDEYYQKYQDKKVSDSYKAEFKHYLQILKGFNPNIKTFCEIGSSNPALLNEAKKEGWETVMLDINSETKSDIHKVVIGNIENPVISWNLKNMDCIWMSHIVEHLKNPIKALINIKDCISDNGLLFVSMPDPFFIDWNCPSQWGHWALREHHIMWDLDSFIEMMEEIGYECVYSKRFGFEKSFVCVREYHILFRKKQ